MQQKAEEYLRKILSEQKLYGACIGDIEQVIIEAMVDFHNDNKPTYVRSENVLMDIKELDYEDSPNSIRMTKPEILKGVNLEIEQLYYGEDTPRIQSFYLKKRQIKRLIKGMKGFLSTN